MRHARLLLAGLAALAAACAPIQANSPYAAVPPGLPSTPLELGDWRRASAPGVLGQFEQNVGRRYRAGLPLSAVAADLRQNEFNCADNRDSTRGDPPDQICRRTVTVEGCTHTWQVHLFDSDNNGILLRPRGLYDRRCGGDGLLGGPS